MRRNSTLLIRTVLCFLFIALSAQVKAQRDTIYSDTLKIEESKLPTHSPTKATLYSTFVPGLGQVYNKKYWKVPIIYAGMGIFIYYAVDQHKMFDDKRDAYVDRTNGDSTDIYLEDGNFYDNQTLLTSLNTNRRNRDLMLILAGTIYVLQIVDAAVDAHLFNFNVSDDLSLDYRPYFNYDPKTGNSQQGLTINLRF